MVRNKGIHLGIMLLTALAGCQNRRGKAPDVSGIPITVHIARFDREFMQTDTNKVMSSLAGLYTRYPTFLPVYFEHIMNFGPYPDTGAVLETEVRALVTGRDIRLLQDTVDKHFPDANKIARDLQQGFRYIKYYVSSFQPPRVVTFISGLANYGAVTADSVLGIGLDMFLGKDFVPYTKVADPYPGYMLYQFSPEFIAPDCFKVLQQQLFPMKPGGSLLEQMIAYGKQLYFLDKVMPGSPDYLKIGYTPAQITWCKHNEQFIWQYFVQNDLLYIHDMQRIMHYIGPGPSTQGMPSTAPGDIGSWIGWQIVRKYMENNPAVTLEALMADQNAQQLLAGSRYAPH